MNKLDEKLKRAIKIIEAHAVRDLKREPLSDEEIDKGYQESDGNYYDLAFRDGVRFAEKAHGITGGGE